MSEQKLAEAAGKRRWLGYAARAVVIFILASIGGVFVAQRLSDGPLNDIWFFRVDPLPAV